MTQEALKLALTALEINLTLLEKITPYKGQEDFLSDAIAITQDTTTFIKKTLAQPEQEPVAWKDKAYAHLRVTNNLMPPEQVTCVQDWLNGVYTHPPQPEQEPVVCCQQYDTCLRPCTPRGEQLARRTWVGLTNEEIYFCLNGLTTQSIKVYARSIEAKLKERNT